jgi:aspartate kinase
MLERRAASTHNLPMQLHVQKYGGTSLATTARIEQIADRIVRTRAAGIRVVVVVSAMGGTTDDLLALAHQVSQRPAARELDMLLTAGERISMALLSMALHERGVAAISFTGSQSGIITDTWHGSASIREIRATRLQEALAADRVVIVAGFQGVSAQREVTTLGRGGSDTTAVALAVTLNADQCDICTDVAGVFTADPQRLTAARLLPRISYEEMLALALLGARVLHPRAADLASRYGVSLRICSSFEEGSGTMVGSSEGLEPARVQGITCDEDIAQVQVQLPGASMRACANLLEALAGAGLSPREMFETHEGNDMQLTLLVRRGEVTLVETTLRQHLAAQPQAQVQIDADVARVAVVGHALQTPGVASRVLDVLAHHDIELRKIQTTPLTLTGLVRRSQVDQVLHVLHEQIGPAD